MNIDQARQILKTQIELERTPKGRPLTKEAILTLDASLSDEKNLGNDVIECIGCGMVASILLTEKGCPNCGCVDLKTDIGV
jgi:hypothetical protein